MKLLLSPLRLVVGWGLSPRLLGLTGAIMLVLLRVSVGWHFYSEGVEKIESGSWSAAPFFANARGPLADQYRQMVWDYDGRLRLDRDKMMVNWAVFRDQIATHYGFSEEQDALLVEERNGLQAGDELSEADSQRIESINTLLRGHASQRTEAQENYRRAVEQYDWVLADNAANLEEFVLGRERIAELDRDEQESQMRDGVSSLGGQREAIRREWQGKAAPALSKIDTIWSNYEAAQNELATDEQAAAVPALHLIPPPTGFIDTSVIDRIVPYFDVAIGLCLLLGLFTPVAALAAAGFLGSVFLSQFPPATGPASSNYQLIECMACLVLAGTAAGRFAGLDYFLHLIVRKVWGAHPSQP